MGDEEGVPLGIFCKIIPLFLRVLLAERVDLQEK